MLLNVEYRQKELSSNYSRTINKDYLLEAFWRKDLKSFAQNVDSKPIDEQGHAKVNIIHFGKQSM